MSVRAQSKETYTPQEVASLLGVHHNSVKNWIRRGDVQAFTTLGGHFRVSRREVARLVLDRGLAVPEELGGCGGMVYVLGRDGEAGGVLSQALGKEYQVLCFSDPFDALMQMGRLAPDLLVMDLDMPGIDSAALARHLHDGEGKRRVQVMGVSGGASGKRPPHEGPFDGMVARGDNEGLVEKARSCLPAAS